MKKFIKYTALSAVVLSAGCMASCSETDAEQDRGNTPVVKYVRDCDPAKGDSLIVAASLGAKLAFIGDNLGDVQQMWFNDQKVKLNPTMVTSHSIIVDVPNVIPSEVNNLCRLITSTGITVDYPFTISIPAPRLDEMDCEWALPGTNATLKGAYFADDPNVPMTVTFPGGLVADIIDYDQYNLTFKVPEGAVEGPITVSTIYGQGKTSFNYRDTRGMLFDFEPDGVTGLGLQENKQGWHQPAYGNDENSLDGTYIRFGNGEATLDNDAWDDNNFAFEHWAGTWSEPVTYPARIGDRLSDLVDFSDFSNMTLKFEMMIPESNPWQACAMQLIFAGVDRVSNSAAGVPDIYGNIVAGGNNSFFQDDNGKSDGLARGLYRPWSATDAFHTAGKWITVSVPIKDFIYNSVGGKASIPLTAKDFDCFTMFVWAGGAEGVACQPIIYIDNIRVVKN